MHNDATRTPLALSALAVAGALVLTACGGSTAADTGTDTAAATSAGPSSASQDGGHSGHGGSSAEGNDADVAFAAGMVPHHAQAVEMSDLVLSRNPPAEVAALARQIKAAQSPEIEQLTAVLTDLGESADPAEHAEHGSHGGMSSAQDLAALEAATGVEAARVYLRLMVEHHEGAVEASDAELADGTYGPARELATRIKRAQQAEIATMQQLLATL